METNQNESSVSSLSPRDRDLLNKINRGFKPVRQETRYLSLAILFDTSVEEVKEVIGQARKSQAAEEDNLSVHQETSVSSLSTRDREIICKLPKLFSNVKQVPLHSYIALSFGICYDSVEEVIATATKDQIAEETHRMVFTTYEEFAETWEKTPRDSFGNPINFNYEVSFSGRVRRDGDTHDHHVSSKSILDHHGLKHSEGWKGSTTIGMRVFFDNKWHTVVEGEITVTRTPKESFLRRMGRI